LNLNPKRVYIDKFQGFNSLIPKDIHSTKKSNTNSIERMNLTLCNRI
jgi:IS1 family transposase